MNYSLYEYVQGKLEKKGFFKNTKSQNSNSLLHTKFEEEVVPNLDMFIIDILTMGILVSKSKGMYIKNLIFKNRCMLNRMYPTPPIKRLIIKTNLMLLKIWLYHGHAIRFDMDHICHFNLKVSHVNFLEERRLGWLNVLVVENSHFKY